MSAGQRNALSHCAQKHAIKSWTADEMHDEKREGRSGRTRAKLTTESMQALFRWLYVPTDLIIAASAPQRSETREQNVFHITPEDRQAPPRHLQARALAKGCPK